MSSSSGLGPRRGPNVSRYIADLNAIPSPQDAAAQQDASFALGDDDLALFTNAEFFDFDLGETVGHSAAVAEYDPAREERARRENAAARTGAGAKDAGFDNGPYAFPDLDFDPEAGLLPTTAFEPLPSSFPGPVPAFVTLGAHAGDKRPFSALVSSPGAGAGDEAARLAAEEDKRRRNTAASARFRVKKKQREAALEKTAKEMTGRAEQFEATIARLEMENKWLRALITEKGLDPEAEKKADGAKKKGVGTGDGPKGEA